jgi:hypothetical protein
MDLDDILMDSDAVENGVWVQYDGDFYLRIASASTREFEEAQMRAIEPFTQAVREGVMPKDVEQRIEAELLAKRCVKDWRGLTDKGVPVPYSAERCAAMMLHSGGYRLLRFVRTTAYGAARFRAQQTEAAKGN